MRHLRIAVMAACAALAAAVALGGATADASTGPALVRVDSGVLRGVVAADHRTFSGIPYAAPPVGRLRWRPPAPPVPWESVRDATRPAGRCPQVGGRGAVVGSEDCLYLNVTTPARTAAARLPVLVWLPGGGFVTGAGSDYDPTRLAVAGHLVVVTLNYRLGALGFLDLPALADPDAGNDGLADQRAALRWVRRNIARFGGDPGAVTLAGQSAGGYSVCAQLAAPAAAGLFERAIVQSAPCGNDLVTRPVAESRAARAAGDLGCTDPATVADCLRAVPADRLATLGAGEAFTSTGRVADLPWPPVAGTPALPRQPLDALRSGTAAAVPLLTGVTHDEMRPFVALDHDARGRPVSGEAYPGIIAGLFGADAGAVLERYPADAYPSPGIALATVLTDWGGKLGVCPMFPAAAAASVRAPVYGYEFAADAGASIAGFPLGSPHAAELPYLFDGDFDGPGDPARTPAQQRLADRMIGYWSAFAATGDPAVAGLPDWPAYRRDGRLPVLSTDAVTVADVARAHRCGFWNRGA